MESKRYNEEIKQLGKSLRNARIQKGLTQLDLEVQSGIDRGDISRIENGRLDIQFSSLVRLAEALDIPTNELLGGALDRE